MHRTIRAGGAVIALALFGVAPAMAQIEGMPLFTNPRMATGFRIHADIGGPTARDSSGADTRVIQAGLGFVLGPVGIDANFGTTKQTYDAATKCSSTPNVACAGSKGSLSLLAQIKIAGGGIQNLSLSLFGGASADLDTANISGSGTIGAAQNQLVSIPLGAAVGLRVPLGMASLNLWGAPRYNMYKFTNCSGSCPTAPSGTFAWAVGADIPVLRVLSIRAAYDSHQWQGKTVSVIGIGASLGIGGMR